MGLLYIGLKTKKTLVSNDISPFSAEFRIFFGILKYPIREYSVSGCSIE